MYSSPKISKCQHYQLIGNHLARLISNTNKLLEVIDTFDITFSINDFLRNVLSKAVLLDAPAGEILRNDVIGTKLYETFEYDDVMEMFQFGRHSGKCI